MRLIIKKSISVSAFRTFLRQKIILKKNMVSRFFFFFGNKIFKRFFQGWEYVLGIVAYLIYLKAYYIINFYR